MGPPPKSSWKKRLMNSDSLYTQKKKQDNLNIEKYRSKSYNDSCIHSFIISKYLQGLFNDIVVLQIRAIFYRNIYIQRFDIYSLS